MTSPTLNLLVCLNEAHVDFIVIGGFAAAIHGCTLVTQDIEICMDFSVDNLLRLQDALADLHPVHRMTPDKVKLNLTPETCRNLKNLYLDTDTGPLDCLSSVKGLGDYSEIAKLSQAIETDSHIFKVLRIESLIKAKEAMNRPQDRAAITLLQSMLKLL